MLSTVSVGKRALKWQQLVLSLSLSRAFESEHGKRALKESIEREH
jgi:hypothetical protein